MVIGEPGFEVVIGRYPSTNAPFLFHTFTRATRYEDRYSVPKTLRLRRWGTLPSTPDFQHAPRVPTDGHFTFRRVHLHHTKNYTHRHRVVLTLLYELHKDETKECETRSSKPA